jgi:succinate dehydrogenase hydrophobic anchor subunit
MATLKTKKGVEAWWGFLAAAIIVIVVVIVLLALFGKIKIGGESAIAGITQTLGGMFK